MANRAVYGFGTIPAHGRNFCKKKNRQNQLFPKRADAEINEGRGSDRRDLNPRFKNTLSIMHKSFIMNDSD